MMRGNLFMAGRCDPLKTGLCLVLSGGLLAMAEPVGRATASGKDLAQGVAAFSAAFDAWSYEGFIGAAALFARAAEAVPASFDALYWRGVAEFHAALWCGRQAGEDARVRAAERRREAGAAFEAALRLKPADAECHALMSTLIGLQIAEHPATALWRGPAALRHRRMALREGPDNPRVHYLVGSAYYHAPEVLGDRRKALAYFLKAELLFEAEAQAEPEPLAPRWGRSSCLTFIGHLHEDAGDKVRAEAYYRKALNANPRDKLARQALEGLKR